MTSETLRDAIRFFAEHAGYSTPPGRMKCAADLALAEEQASAQGYTFEWEQDDIASDSFEDTDNPYPLYVCIARNAQGESVASLGGIDMGHDVERMSGMQFCGLPYKRVVEAELAQEGLAHENEETRCRDLRQILVGCHC